MDRIGKRKEYFILGIYFLTVFIVMYIFYTNVKQLTISDPDDWTYISKIRTPIPSLKEYNPAKVFPETFMGLCGYFAAYCIYPISNDYTMAMSYVYSAVVSFFIATSVICVTILIKKMLNCGWGTSIFSSFCFFAFHFLIFKVKDSNNDLLYTASNLNCFMNYLIPLLSCFIMTILFLWKYIECEKNTPYYICSNQKNIILGYIICWIYLNIFSNMICNIVLVAPCTFLFLRNAVIEFKNRSFDKKFFIKNYMYEYIFGLEIICLIFEGNGSRAASFELNWRSAVVNTLHDLKGLWSIIDKRVFILCGVFIVLSCLIHIRGGLNKAYERLMLIGFYCFFLTFVYIFLLYTRINSHYYIYMECLYPIFIFFLFVVAISIGCVLNRFKVIKYFVPLITYILICLVITRDYQPSSSEYSRNDELRHKVNENIVNQYIMADINRQDSFELHIPEEGLGQYWFTGERISNTMFRHGVTSKLIPVTCVLEPMDYFLEEK